MISIVESMLTDACYVMNVIFSRECGLIAWGSMFSGSIFLSFMLLKYLLITSIKL